jgi:PAS domain S-box-containing protein
MLRRYFTIRVLLPTVTGVMTVVLVSMFAIMALRAIDRREQARRTPVAIDISYDLFAAIQNFRLERGAVNRAIREPGIAGSDVLKEIVELRADSARSLASALRKLESFKADGVEQQIEEIERSLDAFATLRDGIDQALLQAKDSRPEFESGVWLGTNAKLVRTIDELSGILEAELSLTDPFVAEMIRVKQTVWPVRSDSGDDRLLIQNSVRGGEPLSEAQRREMEALAGRIDGAWQLLRAEAQRATTPAKLKEAIKTADDVYFTKFRLLRNHVIEELAAGRKVDLALTDWQELSAASRLVIYNVAKTALDLASVHATNESAEAERELYLAAALMVFFLGMGSLTTWYVQNRVVKPINKITQSMRHVVDGNLSFEIPFEDRVDEIGLLSKALRVFRDTTIKKLDAEADNSALRAAKQEIAMERDTAQRYLDVAGALIVVLNPDATVRLINRHGMGILGYSDPNDIIGKPWFNVFIPERERDAVREAHRRVMRGEELGAEFQTLPVLTRAGEERVLSWHHSIATDDKGNFIGSISSGSDITERLRAEESLRSSEDRFRSIVGAVGEGIFIVDAATGKFTEVNAPGALMFGYAQEDMIGLDIEAISSNEQPYTRTEASAWFEKAVATAQTQQFDWHGRRKDGALMWVEVSIRFASISGKKVVLAIIRDVTDRRKMEAQLRQALKLEAIGTLAGGVAHELNNLLQPIIMMTELVLMDLPEESAHGSQLNRVVDAGSKAAEIVQRILAFGRADEVSHALLDLAFVTREANAFIRTILPASIALKVDIDESVGTVRGDKTQLTQVLINLATNARDAIGANVGTVWVSLTKANLSQPIGKLQPGTQTAIVTVRDSGSGMDKATVDRIFEPFFTTKGVGKGTGLGLSVTHGIIAGHGGAIQVSSEPGEGTSFSIYLPIAENEQPLALAS